MDVGVEVVFKFFEHRKGHSVGLAPVFGRGVAMTEFRNDAESFALASMIIFHHVDGIFDMSKVGFRKWEMTLLGFFHRFDVWKKY